MGARSMFSWFRRRPPAPAGARADQAAFLSRNVWHCRYVPDEWRERYHEVVARMVAERRWEAAGGLTLTDEMPVLVSGVAALLTLGYDEPYAYPDLPAIVLYPGAFQARRSGGGWLGLLGGDDEDDYGSARLGEAWRRGPIVLSWADVVRSARRPGRGHNLVLHEFAHYVDGLNGEVDGVPSLSGSAVWRWPAVVDREFDRLVAQARRGELSLLDQYGATNHAEFFAVATECFFERPHEMKARHGQLFGLMADFYKQDPAEWLPAAPPRRSRPTNRRAPLRVDVSGLGLSEADAAFAEGQELQKAGFYTEAIAAYDRAIDLDPDDAEALTLRASTRLELEQYESALADALLAIELDPEHSMAHAAAAEAFIELGDDAAAETHAREALRLDRDNLDALLFCGMLALRAGRTGEAKRRLKRLVALDRSWDEAHYWLASAYEQAGDTAAAKRHFDQAEWLAAAEPEEDSEEAAP